MKIEYKSNEEFVIYLYDKNKIKNKEELKQNPEKFFKNIFLILKNKHHIKMSGLYSIEVFPCMSYGLIIEINKITDEYYKNYNDGIDLKIRINDIDTVLYEIDDPLLIINNKNVIIFHKSNKYYISFLNEIDEKEILKILEHSNVIYGDKCLEIINPYNLFISK